MAMNHEDLDDDEQLSGRPNKSELKRKMAEFQEAAESLLNYKPKELNATGLTTEVIETVLEAQKMPLKSGRKRHVKFIAKQLRFYDISEIHDMIKHMGDIRDGKIMSKPVAAEQSPIDIWVEKLIDDGNEAQNELLVLYPSVSRQALRTLIRNLISSKDEKKRNAYKKDLKDLLTRVC